MQLIESLKWRYATKKMDATKKVSEQDIDCIKEAVQLSASSYGLQPYTVLDIRDSELRKRDSSNVLESVANHGCFSYIHFL